MGSCEFAGATLALTRRRDFALNVKEIFGVDTVCPECCCHSQMGGTGDRLGVFGLSRNDLGHVACQGHPPGWCSRDRFGSGNASSSSSSSVTTADNQRWCDRSICYPAYGPSTRCRQYQGTPEVEHDYLPILWPLAKTKARDRCIVKPAPASHPLVRCPRRVALTPSSTQSHPCACPRDRHPIPVSSSTSSCPEPRIGVFMYRRFTSITPVCRIRHHDRVLGEVRRQSQHS